MVRRVTLLFYMLVLSCAWNSTVYAETLYLSVAASMTDAFKEIIVSFSETHPETRVLPNFASSGYLAKQISQGAPADLYVSANIKWMRYLNDNSMIDDTSERIFAFNSLVFVGNPDSGISEISRITAFRKIAIGTPQSVPAGQYARQALENSGIYQELAGDRKLIFAKDVRQALIYADRGEVDGAFVYRTDAMLAHNAEILFTVPDSLYDRVSYLFAVTGSGRVNKAARAFHAFMGTAQVRAILETHGFEAAE